jgi:hypothetical protein
MKCPKVFSGGGDSAVCKTKLPALLSWYRALVSLQLLNNYLLTDCHKFILLLSLIVTALAVWLQFFRNFFFKYE